MTKQFQDRVVLITGGCGGIGLATANAFVDEGAKVVLADLNGENAEKAAKEICLRGGSASFVQVDVSDSNSCENMVAHTLNEFGALHIAFNNAGKPTNHTGQFEDFSVSDWDSLISTNLNGMFYSMKAEIPAIKKSGGTAIINTASITSTIAGKGMAAYVTSKHGVAGLTRAASLDLIEHGIRVNAVAPGFVDTGMLAPAIADKESRAFIESMAPIQRIADPREVAEAVLFLASEKASYMVGAVVAVDGGVTIQ